MTVHTVGTVAQWDAARADLLEREKEHTRLGDELARQRWGLRGNKIDQIAAYHGPWMLERFGLPPRA